MKKRTVTSKPMRAGMRAAEKRKLIVQAAERMIELSAMQAMELLRKYGITAESVSLSSRSNIRPGPRGKVEPSGFFRFDVSIGVHSWTKRRKPE